jgi:tetrahydromethanopterin S-methyltransferase subunit G
MAKPKAKAMAKPKPMKKSAPKKKVTLEVIFEDMKKIHKKLDDLEREILAMRGDTMSHTPQSDEDDIEIRFGFLTSL